MNFNMPDKMQTGLPNLILAVKDKGEKIPGFISFAMGNPASEAIPAEIMKKAIIESAKENPMAIMQYGPSVGYRRLIEQTVDRLQNVRNFPTENQELLMLAGSGQGLGIAPRTLCREGDEVYIEEFAFTNAINAILNSGCKLAPIPMDDNGMIPEELEKAVRAGHGKYIYVNPNFQNPTGITMPPERRKAIYDVASRYNLLIYEDDPYGEIRFKGEPVPAFKNIDTEGRVIYAGSYSKTLSAGMRVGYLYGEKSIIRMLAKMKGSTEGQSPILNQMVISKTIDQLDFEAHIAHICRIYGEKCRLMLEALHKYCSSKVKILEPEGGMFLWLEFPSREEADQIIEMSLAAGVGIVPSQAFAANPENPGAAVRLNYTFIESEKIEKGIRILGEITRKVCG